MENPNDTIENGTRDLPTCSTVPEPTAPPRSPHRSLDILMLPICLFRGTKKHLCIAVSRCSVIQSISNVHAYQIVIGVKTATCQLSLFTSHIY